ncbi:efflux RND transporter periplasmic adaptor subunit [Marinobacter sp. SS21]|uniref:efflux RND transporter periplasmic adaptor subunit n=1 Tax=Marinobacter sp. SS21 TaxID=2979460 RepID=UPI00233139AD|nr:efflux RND transporter periplasmic adaptor subunit [Marinobacter sp. SS21]MDC0662494.1 efflux RND transporter periplasmic adaptor subunit [Marinobacter sp. SS21]
MTTSNQRWLWALVLPVALLAGCKAVDSTQAASQRPAIAVRTASVLASEHVAQPLRFSGIVQASQRATLTFQVSGTLKSQPVELGQEVRRGEMLAQVYNPALEPAQDSAVARLEELETQQDQANREWERSRRLFERGVVSEQTLEQLAARRDGLKASVRTARAALAEASRLLQESQLMAPFSGRVEALLVERDEFVAAGQPVMRLSSPQGREVEVRVPAYLLNHLRVGQTLPVWSVQNRDLATVDGSVLEIAQAGAVRGELHPVLVRLPDDTLDAGQPVEVGITPRLPSATTVPLLSVMRSAGGAGVFRVNEGRAEHVAVTVKRIVGEQVVVASSALQHGDQVIYAGLTRIAEGDAVEVLP